MQYLFDLKWRLIHIFKDVKIHLLISRCTWHEIRAVDTGTHYLITEAAIWRGFTISHRFNIREYPIKNVFVSENGGDYSTIGEALNAMSNELGYRHQIVVFPRKDD